MAQLADAVERAPRADSVLGTRESERGVQRLADGGVRYGHWSLLLSWVPVIGDPLTLIAGVMREPLWRFVLIVTLAKGARYALLTALTLGWINA